MAFMISIVLPHNSYGTLTGACFLLRGTGYGNNEGQEALFISNERQIFVVVGW